MDLDQWNRMTHPLKKDEFGVWEITIPPKVPGVCAISHDSKVKVSSCDLGCNPQGGFGLISFRFR